MAIYQYQPYFYIIQDVRNGIYYAGAKWGKDANPSNFMIEGGYTTSSTIINELIRQHGLNSFVVRKLKTFETGPEAYRYEKSFLKKVNARDNPTFYNGHNNEGTLDPDKMKLIMMKKYGVEHNSKMPGWNKKIQETSMKRYGVEHWTKTDWFVKKVKETSMEKYGVEHWTKTDWFLEKVKETSMEKYGVEHPIQSQIVKDNMKRNNLEKYGVENVYQEKHVKEKIKETNMERYGVEHPSYSSELLEKKAQNNLDKYGVRYVFTLPHIREKALENTWTEKTRQKRTNTNLERYGVEVASSSPVVIEKILETREKLSNRKSVLILREYTRCFKIKLGEGWYQRSDEWLEKTLTEVQEKYGYYDYEELSKMVPEKKYSASIKLLQERPLVKELRKYKEKYGKELKLGRVWDRKNDEYLEKLLSEVIEKYGKI